MLLGSFGVAPISATSCSVTRTVGVVSTEMDVNCNANKLTEYVMNYSEMPLIQNHFPELNADEREFLITGMTPEIWDATFGGE